MCERFGIILFLINPKTFKVITLEDNISMMLKIQWCVKNECRDLYKRKHGEERFY